MASRYWVGGTGTWDATVGTKWSATSGGAGGQSVPTSADDVFFNAASGAVTVTLSGSRNAKTVTFTGFTGTFGHSSSATLNAYGNVTFASGMTITSAGASNLRFQSPATCTLISAGKTIPSAITCENGATLSLGDACIVGGNFNNEGIFNTNNFSLTATGSNYIGCSNVAYTRTFNLGSSAISCNRWDIGLGGTVTINAGTSTITCTASSFNSGIGTGTYPTVVFTGTTGNWALSGSALSITSLTTPATTGNVNFTISNNVTIGTFVCSGGSVLNRIRMRSSVAGTRRTLTVTTWSTISDIDFQDIGLNSTRSGTRLGNWGNNLNITFVTRSVYWNLAGTQSHTATGWAITSGGAPAANNLPLAQDTCIFDNAGAAGTVSFSLIYPVGSINTSAKTSVWVLTGSMILYGNLTLGGSVVSTGIPTFSSRGNQSLTSAGTTISSITKSSISGNISLSDSLTCSGLITISSGASISTNNFTVTTDSINISGGTFALGTSLFTVTGSSTAFSASGTSFTGTGTIRLSSASAKNFAGGGASLSGITLDQGGAGTLTIAGANTFANISNSYSSTGATTISLAADQTVGNFTATGTSGNVLTLNSDAVGTRRTLTKTGGGTISVNYMNIKDSAAAGAGATWNAYFSANAGNNTGWIFATIATSGCLVFFI